jgi:hypothetical protein
MISYLFARALPLACIGHRGDAAIVEYGWQSGGSKFRNSAVRRLSHQFQQTRLEAEFFRPPPRRPRSVMNSRRVICPARLSTSHSLERDYHIAPWFV